jgi:hypothetical protein
MCLDPGSCLVQPVVPILLICTWFSLFSACAFKIKKKNHQLCTNSRYQVTMATTICMMAFNVCESLYEIASWRPPSTSNFDVASRFL